jgi:predicted NUDIX family NTP pyrophosphohydrolase
MCQASLHRMEACFLMRALLEPLQCMWSKHDSHCWFPCRGGLRRGRSENFTMYGEAAGGCVTPVCALLLSVVQTGGRVVMQAWSVSAQVLAW